MSRRHRFRRASIVSHRSAARFSQGSFSAYPYGACVRGVPLGAASAQVPATGLEPVLAVFKTGASAVGLRGRQDAAYNRPA